MLRQPAAENLTIIVHVAKRDRLCERMLDFIHQQGGVLQRKFHFDVQVLDHRAKIRLAECFRYAHGHCVIKIRHTLAAVHFVLVGLNRNTGQRRVAADIIGLTQKTVAGGKTAVEQLDQINLAASFRQRVEIHVVDVDVAAAVRLRNVRGQYICIVEALRTLRAVFQHRAHRGIGVNICVLTL